MTITQLRQVFDVRDADYRDTLPVDVVAEVRRTAESIIVELSGLDRMDHFKAVNLYNRIARVAIVAIAVSNILRA